MSGGEGPRAGRLAERGDVLAWLRQRAANAALIAARYADSEPFAADRRRQIAVMIEEIEAEMHCGAAYAEAHRERMAAARSEDEAQGGARAMTGRYPDPSHRSLAEIDSEKGEG